MKSRKKPAELSDREAIILMANKTLARMVYILNHELAVNFEDYTCEHGQFDTYGLFGAAQATALAEGFEDQRPKEKKKRAPKLKAL